MTPLQLDFASVADRNALLDLLIADPRNDRHRTAVLSTIRDNVPVGETFTANTIRALLPHWVHTPVIGATFLLLSRRGVTSFQGLIRSTDPGTHASRIGLWKLNVSPS